MVIIFDLSNAKKKLWCAAQQLLVSFFFFPIELTRRLDKTVFLTPSLSHPIFFGLKMLKGLQAHHDAVDALMICCFV